MMAWWRRSALSRSLGCSTMTSCLTLSLSGMDEHFETTNFVEVCFGSKDRCVLCPKLVWNSKLRQQRSFERLLFSEFQSYDVSVRWLKNSCWLVLLAAKDRYFGISGAGSKGTKKCGSVQNSKDRCSRKGILRIVFVISLRGGCGFEIRKIVVSDSCFESYGAILLSSFRDYNVLGRSL